MEKKLIKQQIIIFSEARKLKEKQIEESVKNKDFFILEFYSSLWKKYNIMELELKLILNELEKTNLSGIINHYKNYDKIYKNEILDILSKIEVSL